MLSVQFQYVLFRVVLCGFVRVHSCVVFCECTMCFKVILHSVGVGCCLCRCVVHDSAGACMRAMSLMRTIISGQHDTCVFHVRPMYNC